MYKEYNSLIQKNTWDLVLLPPDQKLVRCNWIYRTMKEVERVIRKYKARLWIKDSNKFMGFLL